MRISKRRIAFTVIGIVLLAQFWPKGKSNPSSDDAAHLFTVLDPPADVRQILERCCTDCHSNDTQWPWYTYITPVGQWTVNHVNDARRHLNFSDWSRHSEARAQHKLEEIADEVRSGHMPLRSYLWVHSESRLDDAEQRRLVEWAEAHSRPAP
jgi:hypothetical protein